VAFLNPPLLLGLIGLALPLAIHLLARRPASHTAWAAMRFLKAAVERNRKRMKFEGGVLLLMRCGMLALLALALARPAWRQGGFAGLGSSDAATILLLDHSASMAQTDGAVSRFEKAQQAAEQVLDSLPGGSAVAVWLVSDGVKAVIPEPTRDFVLARQAIRAAAHSGRGTDWQPAIQRALDVLAGQSAAGKQLYLFTDGQAIGWKASAETAAMLNAAKSSVQTRVVLVGETEQRNLAVTDLRLTSALAPVGEALQFEAEVSNFGFEEARNVEVSLGIDAETPLNEQTLDSVPPGESKKVSISITLRDAGVHTITARVPPDRAPADDSRTIAIHANDEVNVLLVDGDPGLELRESEVFFLRNALTPVPLEEREKHFIKTKTVSPAELEAQKLEDFAAVVLANVAEVSETTLAALEKYLHAGGGLIVFPGPKTNTAFYNEQMHVQRGFLPASFGDARGNPEQQEQFFRLQERGHEHPIVELWKDAGAGTLSTAHFFSALTLVPGKPSSLPGDAGPPALVLAYADGQPAVMERAWGLGRVVQFSSTAGSKWNDLCLRPAYVPLMHRVLGALLARQNEQLNGRCGANFSFPVATGAAGREASVRNPAGAIARVQPVTTADDGAQLQFDDTDLAGGYEVRLGDDATPFLRFARQGTREESQLAELSEDDRKTLEPSAQVVRWNTARSFRTMLERERTGMEFWIPLVVLGLAVAVGETVLGNRWSRLK
jgi:hypothetical protein